MSRTDDLNNDDFNFSDTENDSNTILGNEAAQSLNITFYYKGFNFQITQRDPNLHMKPLMEKAMKAIDYACTIPEMQPSWNTDTNKAIKEVKQESIPVESFQQMCPNCNIPKIKSKKGNMYCPNRCWIK